MRVIIAAGGREVTIECGDNNVTYEQVADKALAVWRGTEGAKPCEGPAFGLASGEREGGQMSPMSMGRGGYVYDPKASDELTIEGMTK